MSSWQPSPRFSVGGWVYALRLRQSDCLQIEALDLNERLYEWTYQLVGQSGWHRQSNLVDCDEWRQNL